jgi:formylglycine-generating enzyme required for sulfatase activity
MCRTILILASVGLLFLTAWPAHAAKRVALVIGNDIYEQVDNLQKAVNDARSMAETLEAIGFEVLRAENAPRREMNRQLQLFTERLETGDEALFFYAGHGVEIAGRNYLLPIDIPSAKPGQEGFVQAEAVLVDEVLARIRRRGTRVAILVLDACRDNPFSGDGTRSVGASRGLARIPAPEGTFIMYSAGIGQTALDRLSDNDPNPNSVFTRSLIPLLTQSGMPLTQMARQVRREVQRLAAQVAHDQRPAYYDEVIGEFFFTGPAADGELRSRPTPEPRMSAAAQVWAVTKDSDSLAVLKSFIEQFPDSPFVPLARARLRELIEKKVAVGTYPEKSMTEMGRKPGETFRDCADCPEMVVVPAGSFMMGSPPGEKDRRDDEGPQRLVTISQPFVVGKFEVTKAQFEAFVRETRYDAVNKCEPPFLRVEGGKLKKRGKSWRELGYAQSGDHPVACINWHDAKAYVAWLSQKTGKLYHLLSEAEWEYAARAGTTTPYSFGDNENELCKYANGVDLTAGRKFKTRRLVNCTDNYMYTAPVGVFAANAFGLHDMHGNVMEWVEDCWNGSYVGAPSDGSAWKQGDCSLRVLRGGSWLGSPFPLRSAVRFRNDQSFQYYTYGFRVARTLN